MSNLKIKKKKIRKRNMRILRLSNSATVMSRWSDKFRFKFLKRRNTKYYLIGR